MAGVNGQPMPVVPMKVEQDLPAERVNGAAVNGAVVNGASDKRKCCHELLPKANQEKDFLDIDNLAARLKKKLAKACFIAAH